MIASQQIFHTKFTSHRQVCELIIDGGSCENVVATEMVEKLKLKIEDHPQLYKLSWLQKGYSDELLCKVRPMDAYHLLLGCPWPYEKKVIHEEFINAYSFMKDGVKIILGPTKIESYLKPSKGVGNNFLSRTEVKKAIV